MRPDAATVSVTPEVDRHDLDYRVRVAVGAFGGGADKPRFGRQVPEKKPASRSLR
jgi:hypothetical protein